MYYKNKTTGSSSEKASRNNFYDKKKVFLHSFVALTSPYCSKNTLLFSKINIFAAN
jgi:hypothetical protein